jgi:hypothetical protein
MRGYLGLFVSSADRARLAAIVADRNSKQKHAQRAHVVLLTGDRLGTAEIMRRTGLSKPSVWRWQQRYIEAGVDGLLRDKTRPSRIPRLADEKVAEVVRLTMESGSFDAAFAGEDGPSEAAADAEGEVFAVERAVLVGGVVPVADLDAAEGAQAFGDAVGEAEADFGADIAVVGVEGGAAGAGVAGADLVEVVVEAIEAEDRLDPDGGVEVRSKRLLRQ